MLSLSTNIENTGANNQTLLWRSVLLGCLTFCIYTCMYAVRKPFSGLVYPEMQLWGSNVKVWMVISQLLGYTASKFAGIKIFSALGQKNRGLLLFILLFVASLPLSGLPFTPYWIWPILMFVNGFPLGLVWGIVFSFVEGRRYTELVGSFLACTFVFSSGWVKSMGLELMSSFDIGLQSIPFTMAILALIPATALIFLLEKFPKPDAGEIAFKKPRGPLSAEHKKLLMRELGIVIIPIILLYGLLTILRDFRDNFSAEILLQFGSYNAGAFVNMEVIVTVFLLLIIPLFSFIYSHKKSLVATLLVIVAGTLVCLLAYAGFTFKWWNISTMLIMTGGGCYLGYILINISVMDRIIGISRVDGNSGYLIYMADSVGYLFSMFITSFALLGPVKKLNFFESYSQLLIVICAIILAICGFLLYHFLIKKLKHERTK